MDIAMLLVRLTLGPLLVGHGAQHALGWFGGYGADGTGAWLEGFGFPSGRRLALLLGWSEIAAGSLFAVGFLVPLAAATIVGIAVAAAMTDHAGKGPWIWKNGYEYVLVLAVVAVAVAIVGPGVVSIDRLAGRTSSGAGWGATAAAFGLATGVAVLALRQPSTTAAARPVASTPVSRP